MQYSPKLGVTVHSSRKDNRTVNIGNNAFPGEGDLQKFRYERLNKRHLRVIELSYHLVQGL